MLKLKKTLSYKTQPIEYDLILRDQKYIRLKIVDTKLSVSAPLSIQDWEIEHFIYKNIAKIQKVIDFKEKNKKVEVANPGFVKIFDKKIETFFRLQPNENQKNTYKLYESLELTIKHMYKKMSIEYYNIFVQRISYWKQVMNLDFKNLSVKEMKGKWGICYPEKSKIVLNIRLIHYPLDALDYVIVHELTHLVHKNHSKNFWYYVQNYLPNYKKASDLLKVVI
ncbi:M48 family metallopeptidase [Spiroplasma tabanidicola]|uniref:Zinc metalloprotease n=1 Tax=Spiroplasma tabanidicola TaxID=324079 RepID=A0A6I6C765_9MOLU|nr:YgjP-like metallopeptidase domain-containing protein [Spiroplasma tabanidicola]QGS51636.1 zinc metalloprotease [Spiroplasma tabanidicola]